MPRALSRIKHDIVERRDDFSDLACGRGRQPLEMAIKLQLSGLSYL